MKLNTLPRRWRIGSAGVGVGLLELAGGEGGGWVCGRGGDDMLRAEGWVGTGGVCDSRSWMRAAMEGEGERVVEGEGAGRRPRCIAGEARIGGAAGWW